MAKKKGQYVRLFLSNNNTDAPTAVIAAAKSLTLHVSCSVESTSTKDTDDLWELQEVTGINYDISTNALVESGESITSSVPGQDLDALEDIYESGDPVKFQIAEINPSSANNRGVSDVLVSGSVIVNQLSISAPNKQVATYEAQMVGVGDYSTT
jgi:hypothetical protein